MQEIVQLGGGMSSLSSSSDQWLPCGCVIFIVRS